MMTEKPSRPASVYGLGESLSLTDRQNFSIFLRCLDTDSDQIRNTSTPHCSDIPTPNRKVDHVTSPFSTVTTACHYESPTPVASGLTARNKPSRRHSDRKNRYGGWNQYIYLMQNSDLPQESLQYFTSLGQTILNLGTALHSTLRPNQAASAQRDSCWLLKKIKYSLKQVRKQVEAIHHLEAAVAFNISPDESQLWSVLQQRVRMIAEYDEAILIETNADEVYRNISIPSKRELDILKSLVFLYNAYVYHQFMKSYLQNPFDKLTTKMLNELYFQLMEWWHQYKLWCKGMIELRAWHLQPLVEQISQSEIALAELVEIKTRLADAQTAVFLSSVDAPKEKEQLMKNLSLSERRPAAETMARRSRTRYKREHTL